MAEMAQETEIHVSKSKPFPTPELPPCRPKSKSTLKSQAGRGYQIQQVVRLEPAFSLVYSLPVEMLVEIFQHYVQAQCSNIMDQKSGVWLLSRICGRWRSIVLSTPTLWSLIIVTDKVSIPIGQHPATLRNLECFLERSGKHPLSIRFATQSSSYSPLLLERLCRHSHRWARLALCMPVDQYSILNDCLLCLSSLIELELEITHAFVSRPPRAFRLFAFHKAPVLRSLSLPNWHFDPIKSLDIPWHQLIFYSNSNAQGLVDVLTHTHNVVSIKVEGYATCRNSTRPLTLPHLRHLHIRGDTTDVFQTVSMPALINLTISSTRYMPNRGLLNTLGKSCTTLESISLDHLGEGLIKSLISFLSNCPTLQILTISSWSPEHMKTLLGILTVQQVEKFSSKLGPDVAPMLEKIDFQSCIFPLLHAFVDMLESRRKTLSPQSRTRSCLREVNFQSTTPIPSGPLRTRLESLCIEGLKITI